MQSLIHKCFFLLFSVIILAACNSNDAESAGSDTDTTVAIREKEVSYSVDNVNMKGWMVYDSNRREPGPAVLVVHEWWGLNEYAKTRARQLADLGYTAFAVDMYGDGKQATNPEEAQALATPFYQDPRLTFSRLNAAINVLKQESFVNPDQLAAIGYCYGGFVVLNAAKAGADLEGVVSFHGNLTGLPISKDTLQAEVLVCHGGSDPMVPEEEVNNFKAQMDSAGLDYSVKVYPNATHAFTNPGATEIGKQFNIPIAYNEEADKKSWQDMKDFLSRIFY